MARSLKRDLPGSMAAREWSRVIAHVDLDGFYAQVEVKLHPDLKGKPLGVAQYNPFGDLATRRPDENRHMNNSNGSLIAVSYEARAFGVKRNMRGDEARKLCPELQIVQVPTAHGKADLTAYRAAGKEVMDILAEGGVVTERASIDECYLDVTDVAQQMLRSAGGQPPLPPPEQLAQIHVCGADGDDAGAWWQRSAEACGPNEQVLAAGATAVAAARARVEQRMGYTCSAGIAPTKILAKLASGLHKPRQQTVVAFAAIPGLLQDLPIGKLRQLGGKFGDEVQQALSISTVGELAALPRSRLDAVVGEEKAEWLVRLARGLDDEVVKPRLLPKSVGCSKTFRGRSALKSLKLVHEWLLSIGREVEERLAEDRAANDRMPQTLTLGFTSSDWQGRENTDCFTRSCPLRKPKAEAIADDALGLVRRWAGEQQRGWGIYSLGLSTSNFVAAPTGSSTLHRFMQPKGAPADSAASSPVKTASAPRFQLAPSPPQQKLHTVKQRPGGLHSMGHPRQQPRSLFAGDAVEATNRHAAQSVGAATLPAQPPSLDADPIALWGARLHSSPQHDVLPGQTASARSDGPSTQHALLTTSDGSIDLEGSQLSPPRLAHSSAAAAAPADSCPAAEPLHCPAARTSAAQVPEPAAMVAAQDQLRGSSGTTAARASAHKGDWMPSSMDQVDADALSELPLELQAEIRHALRQSSGMPPQQRSQRMGGSRVATARPKRNATSLFQPITKRRQSDADPSSAS